MPTTPAPPPGRRQPRWRRPGGPQRLRPGGPQRLSPGGPLWRRPLAAALLLAVVLAGLDRGSAALAAHQVRHQLAHSNGAQAPTSASIGGFPFLDQVARGRYDELHIRAASLVNEGVRISDLDVTLRGVHVGLFDALIGRVRHVPVDHVTGTALLRYADLDTALERDTAGLGRVRVSGDAQGLRLSVGLSALSALSITLRAKVAVTDGRLHLTLGDGSLPTLVRAALQSALPLPGLPYGLRLATLQVDADGIHFTVTGTNARLPGRQPDGAAATTGQSSPSSSASRP